MTASVLKQDPPKDLLSDGTRFKKASSFELNSLIHVLLEGFLCVHFSLRIQCRVWNDIFLWTSSLCTYNFDHKIRDGCICSDSSTADKFRLT